MKLSVKVTTTAFLIVLVAGYCSAMGLLGGLLGNPMMGGYPYGCGCGCGMGMGMGSLLASRLALSKMSPLGMGCPPPCCLPKPCLATKLLLLKKKLLEKKMCLAGCKCGCGCL